MALQANTLIVHSPVFPPQDAEIIAEPRATAVISPSEETVATDALDEAHVTVCSVAFEGEMYAMIVCFSPAARSTTDSLRITEETDIVLSLEVHDEKQMKRINKQQKLKFNRFMMILVLCLNFATISHTIE
jgi:hypothetical protein